MLDIVGNLKIDETKPERVDYFIACMKSWEFFREHCRFYLNFENASDDFLRLVKRAIEECKYDGFVSSVSEKVYGKAYCELMDRGNNPFVLNFIEDHFTLIDDAETMSRILNTMKELKVDVLKTSFFQIEQNSRNTVKGATTMEHGKVFRMNEENHKEYGKHYGSRFYLGVNFLTTRDFAYKFWNRNMGHRPHEYEIGVYSKEWEHTCMIPAMEIQCAVDDDHGEENTCLLKRNEEKWNRIYNLKEQSQSEDVPLLRGKGEVKFPEPSNEVPLLLEETEKRFSVQRRDKLIPESEPFVFNNLKKENDLFIDEINKRWTDIIQSGIYLLGKQSQELETRLAKFLSVKHCLTVKNCTDAIMIVVKYILRTRPDATVILPNFGAYPTAIAVKNCTDKIHFVDVDESLTIDVKKLPQDIKNGIVIAVHLFGNSANMKHLKRYCSGNGHILIEDCAQSLGSGCGNGGDFSVFSFYPTKPLGTMGDGGAICTNSKTAYQELLSMRNYGLSPSGGGKGEEIIYAGINSRMGELECAVVNAKLDKFEHLIEKRVAIANRYKKIVNSIHINSNCIYHQFPVLFNEREKIIEELKKENIPFMIHYPEHISDMDVFNSNRIEKINNQYVSSLPVGFRVNDKIISLPCHPFMTEEQIQQVEEFLRKHKQYEF